MARRMPLLSLGVLVLGFAGGCLLDNREISFVLFHLGGLGSVSLLASGAAVIARKKGYGYWKAYSLGLFPAIGVGLIGAYLVPPAVGESRPAACGGSVSLLIALIVIAVWALAKRRAPTPRTAS